MTNEDIATEIRAGMDVKYNLELLYEQNKGIIQIYARRYVSDGCEISDLMQEAYFALLSAVEHWDPSQGVKFASYLGYWIRQYMQRYRQECCNDCRVPNYISELQGKYLKFVNEWYKAHGVYPLVEDAALYLGIDTEKVEKVQRSIEMQSMKRLDAPVTNESGEDIISLVDTIEDPTDQIEAVEDQIQNEQLQKELNRALSILTDQQRKVIEGRYCEGKTNKQIAEDLGVNYDRVKHLQKDALRRIRNSPWPRRLRQYLIPDEEAYSEGLKGNSYTMYMNTGISSVERVIMNHYQGPIKIK